MKKESGIAHPPETVEGWYALHQVFRGNERARHPTADFPWGISTYRRDSYPDGWSGIVQLIGSRGDLMLIHFYPTLEAIAHHQYVLHHITNVDLIYSFLSVTEAGLYRITAELAADAKKRGGEVGDKIYREELLERSRVERASEHVNRRLFPQPPAQDSYVCFYPMTKRRDADQNWYTLSLQQRSDLMRDHGVTGRRYAGRVQQVITGAIGLDAWEWGVTLFAKDPIYFKKLVTDMRFDEVSAKYAEFGEFFVGKFLAVL